MGQYKSKNTSLVTILFKPYLGNLELQCLNSMGKLRSQVDFYIIGIKEYFLNNEELILQSLGEDYIFLELDEGFFRSIDTYNLLMESVEFYSNFLEYKHILICQLDALIIREDLKKFTESEYNYIGAPWIEKSKATVDLMVGNGGLSLRKTEYFYKILKKHTFLSANFWLGYSKTKFYKRRSINYLIGKVLWIINILGVKKLFFDSLKFQKVNEDVAFSKFIRSSKHDIPPLKIAVDFSFESSPEICYQINNSKLPFGCHAPLMYNAQFWVDKGVLNKYLLSH